jgi:integrase/recombinase XerC
MTATQEPALLAPRVEDFLTFCKARNLSPNTIRAYRSDLADFVPPLDEEMTVTDLDRKMVRRFVARLHESGIGAASSHRKIAAVKSFCKWLDAEGMLPGNFDIRSITGPRRESKLPDVPSEADIKRLLDGEIPTSSPERDRVILELLYGAGLRVQELCGINIDDFQGEDCLLVRGKGSKERKVIFGEYAQRAIRKWLPVRIQLMVNFDLDTEALLFSASPHQTGRLTVRSVGRILATIAKAKGLPPYNPHLLRHACASHLHDHNAPLQAISTLLGHTNLSTSQLYTRVSVGRMLGVYSKAHPHAEA